MTDRPIDPFFDRQIGKEAGIEEQKKQIRAYIKEKRQQMTVMEKQEKSAKAALNVIRFLEKRQQISPFSWLYCYMDLKKEAGTNDILTWCLKQGIHLAVPKIIGFQMDFFQIHSIQDCTPGIMGILEPADHCLLAAEASDDSQKTCPVIAPGLAFGRDGSRIGYGGGYYDRFLEKEPGHLVIGYGFEFQLYDQVPTARGDRRVDYLITEHHICFCSPEMEQSQ